MTRGTLGVPSQRKQMKNIQTQNNQTQQTQSPGQLRVTEDGLWGGRAGHQTTLGVNKLEKM